MVLSVKTAYMAFPEFSGLPVHLKPTPKFERADLYLINADTKYKARPEKLLQLKSELMHKALTLAYYRKFQNEKVPWLKEHWNRGYIVSHLFKHYYDMIQTCDFDKIIYNELRSRSVEQREGYHLCQFDDDMMRFVNAIPRLPVHVTPPLYYDKYRHIHTCYNGQFYARFESDYFRHETIVVRQAGQELFFAIYFNHSTRHQFRVVSDEPGSFYNSEWIIPFLVKGSFDDQFAACDTTFRETYEIFKGLISFWYDFRF